MIRYGKSANDILSLKSSFISDNDRFLAASLRLNRLYSSQPIRTACKLCNSAIGESSQFSKHGVRYALCRRCSHLNGMYEDTEDFCRAVYVDGDGEGYGQQYLSTDREAYNNRLESIYMPKAGFLADSLEEHGLQFRHLSCADLGAGSGYFVSALQRCGFKHVEGHEVSRSQVRLANHMLGASIVKTHDPNELPSIVRGLNVDIVSMIGVLEHVREPRTILSELRENQRIRFLYISVPLFSPTVFLEAIFPNAMPRHLSGGHTHLFTDASLNWMAKEYRMERVAEWWFGTDVMDLFRSVLVLLEKSNETQYLASQWRDMFVPIIDDLQLQIDRRKFSSEVHILFKFVR